jgi:hypothetical protein
VVEPVIFVKTASELFGKLFLDDLLPLILVAQEGIGIECHQK